MPKIHNTILQPEKIEYKNALPIDVSLSDMRHSHVHYHCSDIELVYCLSGSATIRCNHEEVSLSKGELFTIDCNDIHYIYSNQPNCLMILHIDMHNLDLPFDYLKYVYFSCQDQNIYPHLKNALTKVKGMLLTLGFVFFSEQDSHTYSLPEMTNLLVRFMAEHFNWYNYFDGNLIPNEEIRTRIYNIIQHCQINYHKKTTISDLVENLHINRNYFSQFMRKSPYRSFRNMLGYIRCYESQFLLLSTDLSLLEISCRCGFSDDKYFYKQFKAWWGYTPKKFKDRLSKYSEEDNLFTSLSRESSRNFIKEYISIFHLINSFRFES